MITIYGKDNCGYCTKAKVLAEKYSLEYEYRDIKDPDNMLELFLRNPDAKTVPQIFWDDKYIGGYNGFTTEIENLGLGNYGQGEF
jgi:glutaredoxin